MIYIPDTISFNMIRGDTFELPIIINKGTQLDFEPYYLQDDEKLYIGITQPNEPFENAIIRKVLTNDNLTDDKGNIVLILKPKDTMCLMPGKYYITIKLYKNNNIRTILNQKLFFISGSKAIEHKKSDPEFIHNTDNDIKWIIL